MGEVAAVLSLPCAVKRVIAGPALRLLCWTAPWVNRTVGNNDMVYVITRNETLVDKVKTAVRTGTVSHAANVGEFLLLPPLEADCVQPCVIIDLSSTADAEPIIKFIKASPKIGHLPIIGVGPPDELAMLPDPLRTAFKGFITIPCTPGEIAAVIARTCARPLPQTQEPLEEGSQ